MQRIEPLRQPEIGYFRNQTGARKQNVGWFEISMHDAVFVRIVHGLGERSNEVRRGIERLWCSAQAIGQAAAIDEFKRKVRPSFNFAELVQLDDIWMLEP